ASLVIATEAEGGVVRYRFLETVRVFVGQRLEAQGELEALRLRHAAFFQALAAEAEPQLRGPEQTRWLAGLDADHDNLRAALEYSLNAQNPEAGLTIAAALIRFWRVRGYWTEGQRWLERALARAGDAEPALRVKLVNGLGVFAHVQGDYAQAQ